ncbi:ABC transporter ATP-binding protein [bacterium]|nr:ABC transporter ATP-binding protein [bacterium]MDY3023375.1 ABC transporter ATP-binding protein [Oliverpabstia sp.]
MSDIAISVNNISKMYKLYDNPMDRLKESLGLSKKKRYKEHYALNDISFQVNKGETVGIIGTNGSGKSTILKIITGVLNPTQGNIEVNGRISALLELGAGFNMEYTGIENVYLNGTMIGFSKEEIDAKLQDILEFADIGDFVYQPVKTYSSGMFVRLAFAVAINIDPEILIVDEALSVGDVFFQAKCYRKFEEFKEKGKTILLVSHDLSSISKYCDRVILLNKGKKVEEGLPKTVVDTFKKILANQYEEETEESTERAEEVITEKREEGDAPAVHEGKAKKRSLIIQNWKKTFALNPGVLEYGNEKAEIIDFYIVDQNGNVTNLIEKDTEFEIYMKVRFHDSVKEPIFAYTIKDIRGTDLTGTNTMYEHAPVTEKVAGDEQVVCFRQKMTLQGGEYMLSLGCTGYTTGDFEVFHRLYDVCSLSVMSAKNTIGFFDIHSTVILK